MAGQAFGAVQRMVSCDVVQVSPPEEDVIRTEYSWMNTEELINHVELNGKSTTLEIELAHRLAVALDVLRGEHGQYARGPSEIGRQEAAH